MRFRYLSPNCILKRSSNNLVILCPVINSNFDNKEVYGRSSRLSCHPHGENGFQNKIRFGNQLRGIGIYFYYTTSYCL